MSERDRDTNEDLGYLIVAGVAVAILGKLWSSSIRPWLQRTLGLGQSGTTVEVAGLKLSTVDLVGVGVIVVAALVAVVSIRSVLRRRRREKERRKKQDG